MHTIDCKGTKNLPNTKMIQQVFLFFFVFCKKNVIICVNCAPIFDLNQSTRGVFRTQPTL